jgi:amino acid adenylation domain-containing protein
VRPGGVFFSDDFTAHSWGIPAIAANMTVDHNTHCLRPPADFVQFKKSDIEQSIGDRFHDIAHTHPGRIALRTAERTVTYSELNSASNRIARAISDRRGNEPEPVALLFSARASLFEAMLGVLKAGKFFVHLDSSSPISRIASMLEDARAELILCDRESAPIAVELAGDSRRVMECESASGGAPGGNLGLSISPHALACIVYTSGSTGQPKGVVWSHEKWLHKIMLSTNNFCVAPGDRITLLGSNSANTLTTIFLGLLNGATLLPFDVKMEGVNRLARWLEGERVSFCLISSPLFRSLCESMTGKEGLPELRLIRVASESVYKTDVDLYKKYFPKHCVFVTGLSLAETGYLRIYYVDHDTEISTREVPVGYPVRDKEVFLIDENGRRVGFDEPGEIVVRSKYLSAGYWRRPELTEVKFKPDPQGAEEVLYHTGDLGVMRPDGCLIHKGRKDFRVKIRGYSVEVSEVEKALREHPDVREAVVLARPNASGETRLLAYVTSSASESPGVSELRAFLKTQLPDYMIPSAFETLQAMPLTPNGKIDRTALPEPKNSRPLLETQWVGPRTATEERLVQIWEEVLNVRPVGIRDNFFDLGGHSLAAARVASRVIRSLRLEMPLTALFDSPTVADMAMVIARHQANEAKTEDLAGWLSELDSLSDEEAARLLAAQNGAEKG